MKKTAITFGVLSGIIIILYSSLVFLIFGDFDKMSISDIEKVEMLGFLRYIILLLTIIFAIRFYKKHNGEGRFRKLFLAGLYTAVVVAILVGLMEMVYMLINPDFMEQYAELSAKKMAEDGASAQQIASHRQEMEKYKWMANPSAMGAWYFFETAIIGTIASLIVSLILKTKKAPPSNA